MSTAMQAKLWSSARHLGITFAAVGIVAILQYAMKLDFGDYTVVVDSLLAFALRFASQFVPLSSDTGVQA